MVSQGIFDVTLILVAVVFFFFGAWFYRLILWYPRGRKPLTGSHTLLGKEGASFHFNGGEISCPEQVYTGLILSP